MNKDKKKVKKIFHEKSQILQVPPGCQCHLKYEALRPTACDFMVYKDYKNWFKICLSSMSNQLQDLTSYLSSYRLLCHHPSLYIFEASPMRVS